MTLCFNYYCWSYPKKIITFDFVVTTKRSKGRRGCGKQGKWEGETIIFFSVKEMINQEKKVERVKRVTKDQNYIDTVSLITFNKREMVFF